MEEWLAAKINFKNLFAIEENQADSSSTRRTQDQECEGFSVPFSGRSFQTVMSTYFIVLPKPFIYKKKIKNGEKKTKKKAS